MYGDFTLIDINGVRETATRASLEAGDGLDESWLRDLIFDHPELLPVSEIDSSFGPLVPLCRELRTDVGRIDALYVNQHGRLTLVECKLWKNPQARREVVGQILDYVSALSKWSYADLQRQVSAATGTQGNVPFEKVRERWPQVFGEAAFSDAVSRSLREGRMLALIVGDGIREEVQRISETINRGAGKAFSFGLVEVALYQTSSKKLLVQPRVLARTEIIARQLTVVRGAVAAPQDESGKPAEDEPLQVRDEEELDEAVGALPKSTGKTHLKDWWAPVLAMRFDDPEQEPPYWVGTNNVVLTTPVPGILIKAYASVGSPSMGVFIAGRRSQDTRAIHSFLKRESRALQRELPPGTDINTWNSWPVQTQETEIEGDDARRAWLMSSLNAYVNALRPRMRRWYEAETKRE